MLQTAYQFRPPDEPSSEDDGTPSQFGGFPTEGEDLPYRVEIWDDDGRSVDQVVAVSLTPAIGYAAYYAATREYPGRTITLRHKGRVVSRWSGPAH